MIMQGTLLPSYDIYQENKQHYKTVPAHELITVIAAKTPVAWQFLNWLLVWEYKCRETNLEW